MSEEVELKLAIEADAVEQLASHPLVRGLPDHTAELESIYFDTPTQLLRRHGMALRARRDGRRWLQTLKLAGSAHGALATRGEVESPIRAKRGRPQLDLAVLADTTLPALLAKHSADGKLAPVFVTRVSRTVRTLRFRRSVIEFAVDVGEIRAGRRARQPIREVELELKLGQPRDVVDLAMALVGKGASTIAMIGLATSKAERGYRLLDSARSPAAKASASVVAGSLEADMSSAAALRQIGQRTLDVVLRNVEGLRAGYEPEYVHQARVALRRLRSALRLLDPRQRSAPKRLVSELRWLARAFGHARDWDVVSADTLPSLADEVHVRRAVLVERAIRHRDAARARLLAQLSSTRFARIVLRWQRWLLSGDDDGKRLRALARPALEKAHGRLFEAARFFAALSGDERHRVRILAKRLRYSIDLLAVALPDRATSAYSEQLAQLQDILGAINDLEVALTVVPRLTSSPNVATPLRDRLAADIESRLIPAERCLAALATQTPWAKVKRVRAAATVA